MADGLRDTLQRLAHEREQADREYNDALTALDKALRPPPPLPGPPPPFDEQQITPLNEAWNVLPSAPQASSGPLGRLRGLIWRTVAPYFQRQLTFNSRVVDHINRNAAAHRETQRAVAGLIESMRAYIAGQAEIQSRLMVLLQQITPYVDTKDRDSAGAHLVLNAALSAHAEDTGKRWESLAVRDSRDRERTAAVEAVQKDLQAAIGTVQHAALAARREVERLGQGGLPQAASTAGPGRDADAFARPLDAYKYVGFEDQFRGSQAAIRARLESYLPFFESATDVVDVGCGRGEFLDLLASRGIRARGLDLNPEMVEVCRARGLDVAHADAVGYLDGVPDASVGGVFAAQVVEHLEPAYLLRFLELACDKLTPGGTLVLETLNPACWVAFFDSFIRDITHVWPLHPDTLKYLVIASGFAAVRVEYRSPVPEQDRLHQVAAPAADGPLLDLLEVFNGNVDKLNARMFSYLDYAVVARRA